MTGPELDHDLEAIGRRLSPRLGQAHDAVVTRATSPAGARPRRPRPAPPRLNRLGGAAITVAVTAGFAALLAVGVATRPASSLPSTTPPTSGPAVALATGPGAPELPGLPGAIQAPGGGPATPPAAGVIAPGPAILAPAPTHAAGAGSAPATTPAGGPATVVEPTGPAPEQTSEASAAPSEAAAPTEPPTPTQGPGPGPHDAPTAPARVQPAPTAAGPARIVLTEQDSGRTITIHRGDTVEVDLSAGGPMAWTEPNTSDRTVVARTAGGQNPQGGATGTFHALKAGTADLSATENPNCRPQCMMPSRLWVVHIVVR